MISRKIMWDFVFLTLIPNGILASFLGRAKWSDHQGTVTPSASSIRLDHAKRTSLSYQVFHKPASWTLLWQYFLNDTSHIFEHQWCSYILAKFWIDVARFCKDQPDNWTCLSWRRRKETYKQISINKIDWVRVNHLMLFALEASDPFRTRAN